MPLAGINPQGRFSYYPPGVGRHYGQKASNLIGQGIKKYGSVGLGAYATAGVLGYGMASNYFPGTMALGMGATGAVLGAGAGYNYAMTGSMIPSAKQRQQGYRRMLDKSRKATISSMPGQDIFGGRMSENINKFTIDAVGIRHKAPSDIGRIRASANKLAGSKFRATISAAGRGGWIGGGVAGAIGGYLLAKASQRFLGPSTRSNVGYK